MHLLIEQIKTKKTEVMMLKAGDNFKKNAAEKAYLKSGKCYTKQHACF
jgi:hypothetical protein